MPKNWTRWAQVFWGLAMVGVDLNLGRFDVLPDFVGYALVAIGAGGLTGLSSCFEFARRLSWSLVPVSVVLLVLQGTLLKLGSILAALVDGAMVWLLLSGVWEFAQGRKRADWTSRAAGIRLLYLGLLFAGLLVAHVLAPIAPGLARVLAIGLFVAMLGLWAVILHLIYQVGSDSLRESSGRSEPVELDKAA